MSQFSAPASTAGIDLQSVLGHLLLVSPISQEKDVPTQYGPANPVRADVVDLDTGEEFTDILIFPRVLCSQLKPKIGEKVLGRLGQGEKKAGQSPPWILADFTAADAAKAEEYLAKAKPAFSAAAAGGDDAPF